MDCRKQEKRKRAGGNVRDLIQYESILYLLYLSILFLHNILLFYKRTQAMVYKNKCPPQLTEIGVECVSSWWKGINLARLLWLYLFNQRLFKISLVPRVFVIFSTPIQYFCVSSTYVYRLF